MTGVAPAVWAIALVVQSPPRGVSRNCNRREGGRERIVSAIRSRTTAHSLIRRSSMPDEAFRILAWVLQISPPRGSPDDHKLLQAACQRLPSCLAIAPYALIGYTVLPRRSRMPPDELPEASRRLSGRPRCFQGFSEAPEGQ